MRRIVILASVLAGLVVPAHAEASHHARDRFHQAVALRRELGRLYHQTARERWRVHHVGTPARLRPPGWRLPRLRRAVAWRLREIRSMRHEASWRPQRPPHYSAWICIHQREGAWTDETGNGYHGGLQMDSTFERTYDPSAYRRWGDAGHWPPIEQMRAAERAWRSRGFSPWPLTARACGLL